MQASSRPELARMIGSPWFTLNGYSHHVNDVMAESNSSNAGGGAVVGGLVGLLGGPLGLLIGGVVGGLVGNNSDENDRVRVNSFNTSRYL